MRIQNTHRKRIRRRVPQLNAVATADISFMLLIFFLMTTSMYKEEGLSRQLHPQDIRDKEQPINVDSRNVLTIVITPENKYTVNNMLTPQKELEEKIFSFITKTGEKHIIHIIANKKANYESYFSIQNTIANIYRELRNKKALEIYKKNMTECNDEEQEYIRKRIPQHITEEFIY